MSKRIAVIVASGTGSRMGSEIPKQFMQLGDKPLLLHTLDKFLAIPDCEIIIALSKDGMKYWESMDFDNSRIQVTTGGETRFQSVKNALSVITEDDAVVAIHDGVRPFIDTEIVVNSFVAAEAFGSAVTFVDSKDSVRLIEDGKNRSLERSTVKLIQTPQTFKLALLRKAFETEFEDHFTDDASVVEFSGEKIHLIEGAYTNIKITTPDDLILGEILLNRGSGRS